MPITLNGSTFNNGGTANFNNGTNYSLNEIKFSGYTVWKKETKLLNDPSKWFLYSPSGTGFDVGSASISGGVLSLQASSYNSAGGCVTWAYVPLSECTSVSKISLQFINSQNGFHGIATYFGIVHYGAHHPYYGTGTWAGGSDRKSANGSIGKPEEDDAYFVGSTRLIWLAGDYPPGTAHNDWTNYEFNFGSSPVNLNGWYFIASVSTQGTDYKPTLSLKNIIAV